MTTDMRKVIEPKSDQVNADDFLSGPRTVRIKSVALSPGTEQPVTIELEGSKPFRPCKSVSRLLVAAWGPDSKEYAGKSLTLYCDPKVKWGGMEVGGIRVSHMSHIDSDLVLALTMTKGKKAPTRVKPLKADVAPLKAVEPETSFDWQAFEQSVDDALGNDAWGPQEIAEWWEGQKPNRLQARDADKARAAVVATRVAEHLKQGDY